jgi:hypothetical protein
VWHRKPPDEVARIVDQERRESLHPERPFFIGVTTGAAIALSFWIFGDHRNKALFDPDVNRTLSIFVVSSVFFFVLIYAAQIISRRPWRVESAEMICSACLTLQEASGSSCECGGVLEPRNWYRSSAGTETC